jgi:hypothetical protein
MYVYVATDVLYHTDLPAYVPPLVIGFVLGILSHLCAGLPGNDILGSVIRVALGKPILGLRDGFVDSINRKVDKTRAMPDKIVNAVERRIDEIRAAPGEIEDTAVERIRVMVEEIRAIPGKIEKAVEKKINVTAVATPGRIADSVENAIENAIENAVEEIKTLVIDVVEDVTDAVESVVAMPGRKLEEIGLLSPRADRDAASVPVKKLEPPMKKSAPPPRRPPPPPVVQQKSCLPPAAQKLELPSFAIPKVSVLDLPKVTIPEPPKSATSSPPPKAAVLTKKEQFKAEAPRLSSPPMPPHLPPRRAPPQRPWRSYPVASRRSPRSRISSRWGD